MELKQTLVLATAVALISGGTVYTTIDQPLEVTVGQEIVVREPMDLEIRRFNGNLNFVRPDGHGVLVPEALIEDYLVEKPLTDWEREIQDAVRVANEQDKGLKRTTKITIE